ncbi:MAG: dihydroneopterin aldolase, partial [Chloroflexota bacterium]
MDHILLTGIEAFAWGGISAGERETGQRYRLDLDLHLDLAAAGVADDLSLTVSYAQVHDAAVAVLRERPFQLIESAAERIAARLLARFAVDEVTVRVTKLLPPIDGIVG